MVDNLPRVSLRSWTAEDDARLQPWFQHAEVPRYLVPQESGIHVDPAAAPAWIPRDTWTSLFAVIAEGQPDDGLIGLGALHSPSKDALEIGLIIGEPSVWGQGYGRAATLALAAVAFRNRTCGRVVARVRPDNARALACYRAVGFESRAGHAREPVWLLLTRTAWAMQRRQHPTATGA